MNGDYILTVIMIIFVLLLLVLMVLGTLVGDSDEVIYYDP